MKRMFFSCQGKRIHLKLIFFNKKYFFQSSDFEVQDGANPERLVPTKLEIYPTEVQYRMIYFVNVRKG